MSNIYLIHFCSFIFIIYLFIYFACSNYFPHISLNNMKLLYEKINLKKIFCKKSLSLSYIFNLNLRMSCKNYYFSCLNTQFKKEKFYFCYCKMVYILRVFFLKKKKVKNLLRGSAM